MSVPLNNENNPSLEIKSRDLTYELLRRTKGNYNRIYQIIDKVHYLDLNPEPIDLYNLLLDENPTIQEIALKSCFNNFSVKKGKLEFIVLYEKR